MPPGQLGPLAQQTVETAVTNYQDLRNGTRVERVVARAGCSLIRGMGKAGYTEFTEQAYATQLEQDARAVGENPNTPEVAWAVLQAARLVKYAELADGATRAVRFCQSQ